MVEVSPVPKLAGSDEHEIRGGRGSLTLNLALQEATPSGVPLLKVALTWYEPDCIPLVSIWVEMPVSPDLTPKPLHLYVTVCFGSKFDPCTVALTSSPANTLSGCTEQEAPGSVTLCSPPHVTTRPACARTPRRSVFPVVAEEP